VRERAEQSDPTPYADYPNPDAAMVTLYPAAGAPGVGTLGMATTSGQEVLVDNYSFNAEALAAAEITEHRLLYVTPKLKEDIHLSGLPQVTVKMAASKAAANLSVYLVSLPWEKGRRTRITDNIITRGWADPQNRNDLRKSSPLKPGEYVTLTFELQPDDQIIRKGQQIGLMIFSSDKEYTLHPQPGTEVTVDLGETEVMIPVVGGEEALKKALGGK
ncbi:MAG: CocE/NonD family hydrolase C-terminal non-catalytic domain-containing protein, partial [Bacteroidota bacterium]